MWTYLPSGDDAEIHRCLHSLVPRGLECLALVTNHITESLHVPCGNGNLGTVEGLSNTDRWEGLVVTEPEAPVEVLDAQVTTVCDFMDRNGANGRDVGELHRQGNSNSTTFLENSDVDDFGPRGILDLDCLEIRFLSPVGADGAENLDTGGCGTLEMNDNFLTIAGREEATDGIINV